MPTIALDLDDTLADTLTCLLQWIEEKQGRVINREQLARYELGADRQQTTTIVDAFLEDEAHGRINAVDGARENCQRFVDRGFRLVVVTARKPNVYPQTAKLIERLFPSLISDVHSVGLHHEKVSTLRSIRANVFIEDHPRHFLEASDAGIPSILFGDLPWNRAIPTPLRARSWADVAPLADRLLLR